MVTGKFFRNELEQYSCGSSGCRTCGAVYIFPVQTNQCISIGRSICAEYGSQHQDVSRDFDLAFQYSVSVCDSICGTDFLRGNRSTISCKEGIWNVKTDRGYTGNVLYGSCVLYDLRPDRTNGAGTGGIEYQYGDFYSGCTDRYLYDDTEGRKKIRWQIIIFK